MNSKNLKYYNTELVVLYAKICCALFNKYQIDKQDFDISIVYDYLRKGGLDDDLAGHYIDMFNVVRNEIIDSDANGGSYYIYGGLRYILDHLGSGLNVPYEIRVGFLKQLKQNAIIQDVPVDNAEKWFKEQNEDQYLVSL